MRDGVKTHSKGKWVSIKLNEGEREEIKVEAEKMGYSGHEYLRYCLGFPPKRPCIKKMP